MGGDLADVRVWAGELGAVHERFVHRFSRSEPRESVLAYMQGLIARLQRKNSWTLAEEAGHDGPDRIQRMLNRIEWDADEVLDDVRGYVVENLGDPEAVASPLPVAWVTADSAYGREWRFRRMLEEAAAGYVLAVPKSQHVHRFGRIDHLFTQAPDQAWEKRSCGDGAKGPRVYHWAAVQLPAIEDYDGETPTHQRWALARRSVTRPDEIAYYLGYAPAGTDVDQLVRVAGRRWAIEERFQAAKNECGLDQYEVRRYVGWMRHIALAMLAHAFLAATAAQAASKGGAETVPAPWFRSPWQKSAGSWQLTPPRGQADRFAFTR
ncbi:IS701 family transposase [Streptomyces sp. NPDC055109]